MGEADVPWLCKQLTRVLGFDASEEVASYILSMETKLEVEEYMRELLDISEPKQKKLLSDLLRRWRPPQRKINSSIPDNVQVYKKSDENCVYVEGSDKSKKHKKKCQNDEINLAQDSDNKLPDAAQLNGSTQEVLPGGLGSISQSLSRSHSSTYSSSQSVTNSKKTKFVPLFSEEGESKSVAKLPGRHKCDCLATRHKLINNCMKCGRIVCEQEGSGPCIFCACLVCSNEEQDVLNRGSKKSDKLRHSLMSGSAIPRDRLPNMAASQDEGFERAVKHKNKLLEYDRTSVKRTQVIDDESDYFASDSRWLNEKQRAALQKREDELREQKYVSRLDRKVTLDFAGRQVLDASRDVNVYDVNDSVVQAVHYGKGSLDSEQPNANFTRGDFVDLVNPAVVTQPPQFVASNWGNKKPITSVEEGSDSKRKSTRLQDRELQQMSDDGKCMSMHQPWASLLVKGIKIHEGRTWYTAHRGRLWIAATAKQPSADEICTIEKHHLMYNRSSRVEFPAEYPTGCLLGCVDVTDCLEQDEYRQKYPDGESASTYVFVCDNPQQLVVKFPIKGKHKIYNLDSRILQGARKGLRPP